MAAAAPAVIDEGDVKISSLESPTSQLSITNNNNNFE